jgi:hypothetical protein
MSEDEDKRAYAGPGRETTRRQDMPDDHRDVKEYVEAVDEDVPEEDLRKRVADTLGGEAEQPKD